MKVYEAIGGTIEDCRIAATSCFIRAWKAWLVDDLWWTEQYIKAALHYADLLVEDYRA